jgi:conserved repeat domain
LANVNLATYSASTVTSSAANTSDLASCYYPNLAPNITATKSVRKVSGSAGSAILPGDTLEYTIVTRNSGTLSSSTTTLQDTVPAGTTYVVGSTQLNFSSVTDRTGVTSNDQMPYSVATPISSPTAASGIVRVDNTPNTITSSATDPDNREAVVTFRVTVNSGVTEIRNRATAVHVDGSVSTNETATSAGAPALSVVKSVDSSYVKVTLPDPANSTALALTPQQVVYTITVTNTGTATANNVKVTDTLPTGMNLVSATLARSTSTDAKGVTTYGTASALSSSTAAPNLTFDVGSLSATEPGHSAQLRVTVTPSVTPNSNQAAYLNTARSSATSVAEVTSAQVRTDVIYTRLFKQVHNVGSNPPAEVPQQSPAWSDKSQGLPGEALEYCIDFYNYGSVALNNYVVKDVVPANTTYVVGSATVKTGTMGTTPLQTFAGASVGEANGVVTATIGALAPQARGSLCFRARIR